MKCEWYIVKWTYGSWLNDSRVIILNGEWKYWMMNEILNDQDVSGGIGKGSRPRVRHSVDGQRQRPRCAVELKETEWNL